MTVDFTVCRVCLSDNLRVHYIANTHLQEIYENLTGYKLSVEDALGRPTTVCYICHLHLQRCRRFVDVAHKSERMLMELFHNGIQLTLDAILLLNRSAAHNYTVTPVESISLTDSVHCQTDCETGDPVDSTVKSEEDINETDDQSQAEDIKIENSFDQSSDSEDDLPLEKLKTTRTFYKKAKVKKLTRGYHKITKLDATEVLLSKEEQMSEVLARSKSLNYLNSPYKCHLCYKGFMSGVTYRNHELKHDESSGSYKCEVCQLRYQSARNLRTHSATAHARYYRCNKCAHMSHTTNQARDHDKWHEGFTFECQLCGKKFRKRTSYLTHTRKNHPTESVCTTCGHSFVGSNGLLMHISKTHKREPKTAEKSDTPALDRFCVVCDIQFVNLEAYHTHLLTSRRHSPHESTVCLICSLDHPDSASLAIHLKTHRRRLPTPSPPEGATAPLHCDSCGQTFMNQSRLRAHARRKHLGLKYDRNCVCETCGVKFTSLASLRYHQRRHTGARPHACPCGARFANKHTLRVHARTHSGERPYKCKSCDKRFAQKPALNRHYRVHTGAKPYTCQVCSKSFSQSNSLKAHVQSVHLKMPTPRRKKQQIKNDSNIDTSTEPHVKCMNE